MAVLAVLIAVNVVLLFLLFRPDRALTAQPQDQDPATVVRQRQQSPASPTSSGQHCRADPTPSTRPVEPAPADRLLLAVSSKTAWRATVGDCDTPGKVERSTNGGASWKRIVRSGPAPIVRLGAAPGGNVFTIGGTRQSCSPATWCTPMTAQSQRRAPTRSMCGFPLRMTAMKSMGPAKRRPLHARVT